MGQFYAWLEQQRYRNDAIGMYARRALDDVRYPRSSRLQILLKYEPQETRWALKKAHKEWRRVGSFKTYFVSDGTLIKIGRSKNPEVRLQSLQAYRKIPLQMLLVLPTDREREIHNKFKQDLVKGEWFRASDALLEFVASNKLGRRAK